MKIIFSILFFIILFESRSFKSVGTNFFNKGILMLGIELFFRQICTFPLISVINVLNQLILIFDAINIRPFQSSNKF